MDIEQRLARLYAALSEIDMTDKLDTVKPVTTIVDGQFFSSSIDFSGGLSAAAAANRVSLLINNIACLKDHLKLWCKQNDKTFTGERLINTNIDVAVIHDLWNLDKHAELDKPSRSGLSPHIDQPPQTALVVSSNSNSGPSSVTISFSPTGVTQTQGNVSLRITADVVDGDGKRIDGLEAIALRAIAAWGAEFTTAGVALR